MNRNVGEGLGAGERSEVPSASEIWPVGFANATCITLCENTGPPIIQLAAFHLTRCLQMAAADSVALLTLLIILFFLKAGGDISMTCRKHDIMQLATWGV